MCASCDGNETKQLIGFAVTNLLRCSIQRCTEILSFVGILSKASRWPSNVEASVRCAFHFAVRDESKKKTQKETLRDKSASRYFRGQKVKYTGGGYFIF